MANASPSWTERRKALETRQLFRNKISYYYVPRGPNAERHWRPLRASLAALSIECPSWTERRKALETFIEVSSFIGLVWCPSRTERRKALETLPNSDLSWRKFPVPRGPNAERHWRHTLQLGYCGGLFARPSWTERRKAFLAEALLCEGMELPRLTLRADIPRHPKGGG